MIREESGNTATEYAVMLSLIIMACFAAITSLGTKISSVFSFMGDIDTP
jgi:Flp pilus assembly pilin Flp